MSGLRAWDSGGGRGSPHLCVPISGENIVTDGHVDLSRLEVSLTLTNKFEGLEADADHTGSQSLLLR